MDLDNLLDEVLDEEDDYYYADLMYEMFREDDIYIERMMNQ